jgi:DNA repair protein RecO (recombination protein O)
MAERRPDTLTPGYVLHRRPYRDTSVLAECYTRAHGRIGVVARGARAPKARLAGVLQPFQALLISFAGRGELATLRTAELDGAPAPLGGAALAAGFYANELLLRACAREDPHPALFDAYGALLAALAARGLEVASLRAFELALLRELGYAPPYGNAAGGESVQADGHYRVTPGHAPEPVSGDAPGAVAGSVLLALATGAPQGLDAAGLRVARVLLQAELHAHFGERPWQSRRLYAALAGALE